MKHLKKFNEGKSEQELKEFCDDYLAYLYDDGFTIKIFGGDFNSSYLTSTLPKGRFNIWLQKDNAKSFFKWDDVKDYYIPFLQVLLDKYDILSSNDIKPSIRFRIRQKKDYNFVNLNKDFSYIKVLNDDLFDTQGYWKDSIFYKWIPDPDMIGIMVSIKQKNNQVSLDI
jgi:hypothetical protein